MWISNQIKAVNQRLADFEKKGLKDTTAYKNILMNIERSGLKVTKSKSGELRISRSKENLSNTKVKTQYGNVMNKSDILGNLLKGKTVGKLRKEAKEQLDKNASEQAIYNKIFEIDERKEYISSHLSEWYLLYSIAFSKNTHSIIDYNEMMNKAIKETAEGVRDYGEEYLDNAPDYIKQALKGDI